MSATAVAPQPEALDLRATYASPAALRALGLALLLAVGSLALYPLWRQMYELWSSDPLRSIGGAFPLFTLLGVLAAWRRLGWRLAGNWWGLLPVALSLPLARFTNQAVVRLTIHGHSLGLAHPGVVFLLYAAGAVLLFGGWPLLRASLAPLALLLAVNPVPFAYNTLVDLPLQELSANTARAFAHLIGLHPSGEQLKMMFAPDFGMLIVPGCNGVRGSITFAYLALIFGYSRGLRPRTLALVTGSAFVLGYALNLLRLCVLVIYYRVGLSFPAIQPYGVGVDYCIGCTIFLFATLSLGLLIRSLERPRPAPAQPCTAPARQTLLRVTAFAAVVLVFLVPQLDVLATPAPARPDAAAAMRMLPAQVGDYHLARTYYEQFGNGTPATVMGEYVAGQGPTATRLTLGLYIAGATHALASSRMVQGAHMIQSGALQATTRAGLPVQFATSLYDDGIAREFDAEASCSVTGCAYHVAGNERSAFVLLAPAMKDLVLTPTARRLPLYLQRQWPDSDPAPTAALRTRFEQDAQAFMAQLELTPLVTQLGSRP